MSNLNTLVSALRRPKLLIRAARFGLSEYQRERDLYRLIQKDISPENVVKALLAKERKLENTRKSGDATYSIAQHIEILIALLAETRFAQEHIS